MCLAIPARIIGIDADSGMATASLGNVEKQISIALVPDVKLDDYVLVHVGYALNKIDRDEAEKTLILFAQAGLMGEKA